MMNYDELMDEDLELGSGAVEGAVKFIIGKRCDQGGMRWIVERNEAVIQPSRVMKSYRNCSMDIGRLCSIS